MDGLVRQYLEVKMDEFKWVRFMVVFGRAQADMLESYLNANGVDTQLIQEAYYQYHIGAGAAGEVDILVPNTQLEIAKKLYAESGWNFDVRDSDGTEPDETSTDEDFESPE
jgi:hypothetical protein